MIGLKIISIILLVSIIFICHSYGFFKYGMNLFDNDFNAVYKIVCKNTNVFYQYVKNINKTDEYISVTLKQHTVPYVYIGLGDTDTIDFHSAFNIYTNLSELHKDKKIYVNTGAVGSSDCSYSINDGQLSFKISCPPTFECELSFYDILSKAMLSGKIHTIDYEWSGTKFQFDSIKDTLPINKSITSLKGFSVYTDNLSAIAAFQGLKKLDLSFIYDENNNITDMAFLNSLLLLEDLTFSADCKYLDFTYTKNINVKNITFNAQNCTDEFEKQFAAAFPNAQISIVTS